MIDLNWPAIYKTRTRNFEIELLAANRATENIYNFRARIYDLTGLFYLPEKRIQNKHKSGMLCEFSAHLSKHHSFFSSQAIGDMRFTIGEHIWGAVKYFILNQNLPIDPYYPKAYSVDGTYETYWHCNGLIWCVNGKNLTRYDLRK